MSLPEARSARAKCLRLTLSTQASASKLKSLLTPFTPGACQVRLLYRNDSAECELVLGDSARVRLDDDLLEALERWLTAANVSINY